MAEARKQELLVKLKPIIVKMMEATTTLELCCNNSRSNGAFDTATAVQAMSMVVPVQMQLSTLVQSYSADAGSGGTPTPRLSPFPVSTVLRIALLAISYHKYY